MSRNTRKIAATPDEVFAVVANGWLFPAWVVGASRIRAVEQVWPAEGSHIHHSFGLWPLLLNDRTTVHEWDAPRRAVLRAHGWPLGEAEIVLEVKERGSGSVVRIRERAVTGPGSWIPAPILDVALHIRNTETLRRLAYLAEARERPDGLLAHLRAAALRRFP